MADWLAKPWIEKAICAFYDKNATQPKFARAQIIQFNKVPSENSASAEALLSDKWMYAKAIFTPQSIEEFEKSSSNICEFSMCDIKGGLIFLNDYRVVPQVNYAKGVWEHLLIVNKFTFKGSEKSSQFGSELINSAAHSPFQVRIKKHFQLKQIVQLLQKDKNKRKLTLDDNKAFDIQAITNSFIKRHQFVVIPDEQQKVLDDIQEWRSDFCPPSTMDQSNSLNTSLPSNQQVQNDVSMSPKSQSFALEQHSEQCISGVSSFSMDSGSLGNKSKINGSEEKEILSLYDGYLVSKRSPVSMVPSQPEENSASESPVQPSLSAYGSLLDILENFEHQSDRFAFPSGTKKRGSVGDIVEEEEEVEDWSKATNKDKQVRRSSIELALAKQMKMRDDWLGRCSKAEASFHDSSLSGESLDNKEIENHKLSGSRPQKEDSFSQGNSTAKDMAEFSRVWLEFSQSQYLEGRELDAAGDKCVQDLTAGDQVEIVFEDGTDDSMKRTVKRVISIGKEDCHSGFKKDGSIASKSYLNSKLEKSDKLMELESHEMHKNSSDDCSSDSRVVTESGNCSYFPGIIIDGVADCSVKEKQYAGLPGDGNWQPSRNRRVVPESDEMKGIGARGRDENTFNTQHGVTGDERFSSKENSLIQHDDSIVGTDGDDGCDGNLNSTFVVEDKTRGADAQVRNNQRMEQELDDPLTITKVQGWNKNIKNTKMEYDESCSVLTEASRKEREELCKESYGSKFGELSTTGVVDKVSCSVEGVIPNTISDGSSSLEQKSDESFSILKNTSISDLTPGGFQPAFTSTARPTLPSNEQTRCPNDTQDHHGEAGNLTAAKKRVTFGKSIVYMNRYDFEEILKPESSQVVASPYNNDLSDDDDSMVPCTQQEDDENHLMTFNDPLQILRTMSSSVIKVLHPKEHPKSKALGCQAADDAGRNDDGHHNVKYKGDEIHRLVGNILQFADSRDRKSPASCVRRRREHDEHASHLATCDSDKLHQESLDDARRVDDGVAPHDNNSHASSITGENEEIILCSDESEEFVRSPRMVAKDSVLQCIKQSTNTTFNNLVMGSDDSPGNMTSSSPKAAMKQNILRCIQEQGNRDSRDDVTRARIQTKQTSASSLKSRKAEKTGVKSRESLQFTLTDSELCKAVNSSPEKENASLLESRTVGNLKGKSSLQHATSTTPVTETRPCSISTFYKTKPNDSGKKRPREGEPGCDVNAVSLPEDEGEEVECLMYVPWKGLEKSAMRVTLDSRQSTKLLDRNVESIKEANEGRSSKPVSRRQTDIRLSREHKSTERKKDEQQRRELPQLSTSNNTVVKKIHKNITSPSLLDEDNGIPNLDNKGAHDGNKAVAMETHVFLSGKSKDAATLVEREGRLKRKRPEDEEETRTTKKLTISAPSATSAQISIKSLNATKNKCNNERVLNADASSQAFTEYSCDHMLYSQQDPLVIEFSPAECSDDASSQESKIKDLLSSPILLPSPPREITVSLSSNTEVAKVKFKKSEKGTEETCMSEVQEPSSPNFVSLPSYQVPTTNKNNKHLRLTNKPENTNPHVNTTQGKTKPFILSDSEEDENESDFCWFTTR